MEGHLSAVTHQYTSGAGVHIRAAWGHGHGAQGDPEWPVGCGMRMGHGRSLVVKEWHAEQTFLRAPFHLPSYTPESATPAVVACRGWPWWHVEGSDSGQWAVTRVARDRAAEHDGASGKRQGRVSVARLGAGRGRESIGGGQS